MHIHILKFIYKYNLLFSHQHGFRHSFFINTAIIDTVNITNSIDKNLYAGSCFIDTCKAFDSLSHSILLQKLAHLGFRDVNYDWFKDHLSHRYQYIQN